MTRIRITAAVLAAACHGAAAQTSTMDPAKGHAWAQNAGWLTARHDQPSAGSGIVVSEYFLTGRAWAQNLGWIDFGGGQPVNHIRYENSQASDCGVNHFGNGELGGFAWSQNAGWIHFGWATSGDPNRPRINLATGAFLGYAWGQNIGWINLATTLATLSIDIADADADGMDDSWEVEWFTKPTLADTTTDHDGDGVTDAAEFIAGTNPTDASERLRIVASTLDRAEFTMWITAATTSGRRFYQVSRSTDLMNWEPGEWYPGQAGSMTFKEFLKDPLEPQMFFRVLAKRPLAP